MVLSDDGDGCEESDEAARGVVVFVSDDAPRASTCTPSAPAGVPCAPAEAPFADCESLSTPTVPVPVFTTNRQRALANAAAVLASHKLTPHTILVEILIREYEQTLLLETRYSRHCLIFSAFTCLNCCNDFNF